MIAFIYSPRTSVKIDINVAVVSIYRWRTGGPARLSDLSTNTQPVNRTARLKGQSPCAFLHTMLLSGLLYITSHFLWDFSFLARGAIPDCRIISEFYDSYLNHRTA